MMPTNTDTQQIERQISSAEQAADLGALRAAAQEEAQAGPDLAPAGPVGPDLAQELAAAVAVAVAILSPMYPSLKTIYTPEATNSAAAAVAAVCRKHGWMEGGIVGKWGEEIACLAVCGPLAVATYKGIEADTEARKPKPKPDTGTGTGTAPEPEPGTVLGTVGQKTVKFG